MAIQITKEQLIKLGANPINAEKYYKYINDACAKYEINTNARVCAFLAQIFEETGNLEKTKENLNYSAQALLKQWPTHFNKTQAYKYGRADGSTIPVSLQNQIEIAKLAYGDRGGNIAGSIDGWNFRGRGFIQITFRSLYKKCGDALGIDLVNHPELLELPQYTALSAAWYWFQAGCNKVADSDNPDAVKAVTKIVNGGYGNLDIRMNYWNEAKKIWS